MKIQTIPLKHHIATSMENTETMWNLLEPLGQTVKILFWISQMKISECQIASNIHLNSCKIQNPKYHNKIKGPENRDIPFMFKTYINAWFATNEKQIKLSAFSIRHFSSMTT